MNKKLAMLMFAIGLGAATAPAFSADCYVACGRNFNKCLSDQIFDVDYCNQAYDNCIAAFCS
jgi:hypothetical protein